MRRSGVTWQVPVTVLLAVLLASARQTSHRRFLFSMRRVSGRDSGTGSSPPLFIVSLFSDDVRIYAFPNAGRWYDFGFMLGISGFSGGVFAGSRRRPER
jgi:hypothetical protein